MHHQQPTIQTHTLAELNFEVRIMLSCLLTDIGGITAYFVPLSNYLHFVLLIRNKFLFGGLVSSKTKNKL